MSQDWSLTPATAAPAPIKGKGMIWTGAVLLVVGLVLIVVGIVGVVSSAASLISGFGAPVQTPAKVTRTLEGGTTYAVYELSSAGSGSGTKDDPLLGNVSASDVSVVGPDGSSVAVTDPGELTQTYSSGSKTYFIVASFDAPATGSYEISVGTEGSEVLIAPSITAFGRSLAWIGAIGIGGLLALLGLILLIVGIVRRSSSKKKAVAAGGGAYPVASYPGQYAAPAATSAPMVPPAAVPVAGIAAEAVASPPVSAEPEVSVTPEVTAPPVEPQVAPVVVAPVAPVSPAAPAPPVPAPPAVPAAALPPAGWYPDPGRPGGQRYWDGARWTEHTA